jgi:hypothetical protein
MNPTKPQHSLKSIQFPSLSDIQKVCTQKILGSAQYHSSFDNIASEYLAF